jgi:hypothetical protein
MKPFYKPSPYHQRKLAIMQKNFQFLPHRSPSFADENKVYVLEVQTSPNF